MFFGIALGSWERVLWYCTRFIERVPWHYTWSIESFPKHCTGFMAKFSLALNKTA